jgi:prepilin signal peptidase PulO-like enzyme (type II secretory pathway)
VNPWWIDLIATVVFGCVGYLSVQLSATVCKNVVPFEDGPKPGRPPVLGLILGCALVGFSLALRGAPAPNLIIAALILVPLVACWYSDVRCGILPDYFTIVPLAFWLLISVAFKNYTPIVSAIIVFVPFGLAAFFSKGRGMGWGDVKLVTLGAAVLGLQAAALAFGGACLVAVFIAMIRRRRSEPIAFAPYLACSIALVIAFPVLPPAS